MGAVTELNIQAEVYQNVGFRPAQEDGYALFPVVNGQHIAAVFDGHSAGSDELVQGLARQLPNEFDREYDRIDPRGSVNQERRVLRGTLRRLVKRYRNERWLGSTATVAWFRPLDHQSLRVHIAILGDSPAAVWDGKRLYVPPLHDPEHHPDRKKLRAFLDAIGENDREEYEAYRRAGISRRYVWRVRSGDDADGVGMTRAIGDERFGKLLIRRPEIHTREVPVEAGVVVLATDGVLGGNSSPSGVRSQMAWIVEKLRRDKWPLRQVGCSGFFKSGDNRTIIAVTFNR